MATAPSIANYSLGKGILQFDRFDSDGLPTGLADLGNAPAFSIQPTVETLEHFSSREGIKKKDKTVIVSAGLSVKFTLDEMSAKNLALAMMGTEAGGSITLLASTSLEGKLVFTGANEIGPRYLVTLHRVSLKPTAEIPFITDDWAKIEFEGEVMSDIANNPSTPYGTIAEIVES
jgi:hypothetical protein